MWQRSEHLLWIPPSQNSFNFTQTCVQLILLIPAGAETQLPAGPTATGHPGPLDSQAQVLLGVKIQVFDVPLPRSSGVT